MDIDISCTTKILNTYFYYHTILHYYNCKVLGLVYINLSIICGSCINVIGHNGISCRTLRTLMHIKNKAKLIKIHKLDSTLSP